MFGAVAQVMVYASCDITGSDSQRGEYQQAHERWLSKGGPNYTYQFRWSCFCPPNSMRPANVIVRGGAIDSVVFADSSRPVDRSEYGTYRTIEELFEFVNRELDNDDYSISVTYDAEFGYPRRGSFDREQNAADDEIGFVADSLVLQK
jgi:hypothetical protein